MPCISSRSVTIWNIGVRGTTHPVAQQFNEVALMQEHVYELEKRHCDIVAHYEDEVKRLRSLLDARGGNPGAERAVRASPTPPNLPPPGRGASPAQEARSTRESKKLEESWPPVERSQASARAPDDVSVKKDDAEGASTQANEHGTDERDGAARSAGTDESEPVHRLKKEGSDWIAMYNPQLEPALDVNLVHTLIHDSVVCCVRFSPDGKSLATGSNLRAQIYDAKTGAKTCVLEDGIEGREGDLYIRSVCFSPDGRYLATGAEDHLIRIWDIAEKKVVKVFSGHEQEIYSLEYSEDGRMLGSGSGDKTVRLWDVEKGTESFVLYTSPGENYGPGVTTISISPDGRLVAAGALDTFVRLWDTKTGKLRCRLKGHKDSIYSVGFMPDGKTLASGSLDKTVKLWDLSSLLTALDSIEDEISSSAMCIATMTGHKDYVLSVTCSADGRWIASGSKDRTVQFWDPKTGQSQLVLQGHKNSVIATCLSKSNNLLATGSGDFKYVVETLTQCTYLVVRQYSVASVDVRRKDFVSVTGRMAVGVRAVPVVSRETYPSCIAFTPRDVAVFVDKLVRIAPRSVGVHRRAAAVEATGRRGARVGVRRGPSSPHLAHHGICLGLALQHLLLLLLDKRTRNAADRLLRGHQQCPQLGHKRPRALLEKSCNGDLHLAGIREPLRVQGIRDQLDEHVVLKPQQCLDPLRNPRAYHVPAHLVHIDLLVKHSRKLGRFQHRIRFVRKPHILRHRNAAVADHCGGESHVDTCSLLPCRG